MKLMGDNRQAADVRAAFEGLPNARVRDLMARDRPTLVPPADDPPHPPSVERALRASRNGHTNGKPPSTNGKGHL